MQLCNFIIITITVFLCTVKSVKAYIAVMPLCVHSSICSRLMHWMSHC